VQAAGPKHEHRKAARADPDGLVGEDLPVAASIAAMVCERLWLSAPSTIMAAVPSVLT
jgi:hypothetical protein